MKLTLPLFTCLVLMVQLATGVQAQTASISGRIVSDGKPLEFASVGIPGTPHGTYTDAAGNYRIEEIPARSYRLQASSVGFSRIENNTKI